MMNELSLSLIDVPERWKIKRFRDIFSFSKGLGITKENLQEEGIPCVNYGEIHSKYGFEVDPKKHSLKCVSENYLKNNSKSLLNSGDIVFADTSEDIEGSGNFTQLVSDSLTFAGYHTVIARPKEVCDRRYVAYLLESRSYRDQVRRSVKGVKVYSITKGILKNTKLWFPELSVQKFISGFLDKKTAQIDEAVAIKEKQIALLKERKQIIIQKAVTQGLNPDVLMKDSGVDWIGQIPEHWAVKRFKYLAKVRYGLGQPPKALDGGLKIIRATNVERGKIVEKGMLYVDPADIPWDRNPELREGEIIVVRSGAYTGDSALVTKEYDHTIAGYDMVATPTNCYPSFLSNALLSKYVLFDQIYLHRMRSAQPHLNAEELNELWIAVPPHSEQIEISNYLSKVDDVFESTTSQISRQIANLKEYKSTLINSAVTGKIKVA